MNVFSTFLKGTLIGVANTIPGVSGGTIAVVTGIYDRLIAVLSGFFREKRWKTDLGFVVSVVAGVLTGLAVFSQVIGFFLETYPQQAAYFFAGLILGSVPFLVKLAGQKKFHWTFLIPLVSAFALMAVQAFTARPEAAEAVKVLTVFTIPGFLLAGILSAGAMIVPGISGSFLLILIGYYSAFLNSLREFNIPVLAVFLAGALIGMAVVSKGINILLKKFHGLTYYGIIGLVAGSVLELIVRSASAQAPAGALPGSETVVWLLNGAALLAGLVPALLLGSDRKGSAKGSNGKPPRSAESGTDGDEDVPHSA